jgi:hypothetical protein
MTIPGQFGFYCPSGFFFSETTNIIKAKLYMNVHWMILYKLYVFCSGMKFKMATTAGLSLKLDPMGKMFHNASSLKPRWWPSWISDRHKKQKICREPSNDHSWAVWFQLSKWFQRRSVLKHFPHRVQC